jgi:hypothetical protein
MLMQTTLPTLSASLSAWHVLNPRAQLIYESNTTARLLCYFLSTRKEDTKCVGHFQATFSIKQVNLVKFHPS